MPAEHVEAYERKLIEDTEQSLEAALRMFQSYKRDGAPSVLYNVRTQAQQATQWTSELIGLLATLRAQG